MLSISIPISEPVVIIALVMTILLIGPVLFERIRIPSIAGLLLSGAIIGPHGFNLVSPDMEFTLLGTMGLLYLLFLAGLEIDLIDFIENKLKSIFIGLASFIVPFIMGFAVSRYLLSYSIPASWLIGAMLSSHTLISYPLLGKLGIINKSIVTVTVGATIIADILALLSMELITDFADKGVKLDSLLLFLLNFSILFFVIFIIIPKISRIFLAKYEGQLGVQYIFVLVMLFGSAVTALLLNIEPIIGAFFSGLVLNRQVINSSPLYKRIEFIGNNLFIPFFLISIGILANFRIYIDQPRQTGLLLILITVAFLSKYIAAWLSKLFFRISNAETNLLFGLSLARAASAIAIILIGFNMGLVSEAILNNTVILILVTSIASSYITQAAGKKIRFNEHNTISSGKARKQRLMVPVSNPANMENLLDFAILLKQEDDNIPIYPLTVFTRHKEVRDRISNNQEQVLQIIESLQTDTSFETSSRIDKNVTNGIVRAAEEVMATAIIMGWNDKSGPFHVLFGNVLDKLLKKTRRMVLVLKVPSEFRKIRKIHLFCTENAQYEEGFPLWMDTILYLTKKLLLKISVYCDSKVTTEAIIEYSDRNSSRKYLDLNKNFPGVSKKKEMKQSDSDLIIFVNSRKNSVSYSRKFEHEMNLLTRNTKNNIIIIYPEQKE